MRELASGQGRSLLFMRTKHTAKKLAKQLTAAGHPRRRAARQPQPGRPRAQPGGVHRRRDPGAGRHRHRRPRHPRRRRRAGRARRPADRAQGLPAPLRPHRPRRRRRHRRHPRDPGPGRRGAHARPARPASRPTRQRSGPARREITALTGPAAPYVEPAPVVEQPQGSGGGRRGGGGSGRGPRRRGRRGGAAAPAAPASRRLGPRVRSGAHPRRAGRPRRRLVGRLVQRPLAPRRSLIGVAAPPLMSGSSVPVPLALSPPPSPPPLSPLLLPPPSPPLLPPSLPPSPPSTRRAVADRHPTPPLPLSLRPTRFPSLLPSPLPPPHTLLGARQPARRCSFSCRWRRRRRTPRPAGRTPAGARTPAPRARRPAGPCRRPPTRPRSARRSRWC